MTTASTDPRDIEAELERDRAQLASTLDELSDRVSVDSLARDALDSVKSYAGSYTSTLDGAVRTNPVAVAMVGAGLAWLALSGRRKSRAAEYGSGYGEGAYPGYASGPVHDDTMEAAGFGTGGAHASSSFGGASAASLGGASHGSGSASASASRERSFGSYEGGADDDRHWWSGIADLRSKATDALRRLEHEARDALSGVGGRISGGAGGARDFAAERASVVSGFASDLRSRLSHGLDSLPEGARERVIAARERAYAASLKAEQVGRQAVTDPAKALEEHPLVAGAVAFALGAAVAAMLPRTEAEDRAFGEERDRLMDEASRLLRSERERAMGLAGSLMGEVRAAATEAVSGVAEVARTQAAEAAGAVADAAREQAREAAQRLGEVASDEAERLGSGQQQGQQHGGDRDEAPRQAAAGPAQGGIGDGTRGDPVIG